MAVHLPVPGDPTVSFSIQIGVGSQDDPPGKAGLAHLTGALIEDGSTRDNAYETILEKLYPLASSYHVRTDREVTTLTGRTHRDNLEAFVELFTAALAEPAFSESDFMRLKNDTINYLANTLRYSSDEELGKAVLYEGVFDGTPYAHPPEGTVASLGSITREDVQAFYRRHYTQGNVTYGLAGDYPESLPERIESTIGSLPAGEPAPAPAVEPRAPQGRRVVLVDKPGADASISFGFPIDVTRGEREFYALWIANSWLGEHRNQASHLFQVIRETRGLNYGDYSYIEAFPEGGERTMPPVNVPRRHQIFEVWIRTLPNEQALFALRAALRELKGLVDEGLTAEEFELTRGFLSKYSLHFAETTAARLGYAMDDAFYRIGEPGHLERFRRMMDEITLEEVNAAIAKHLRYDDMTIAIVTGDAAGLRETLVSGAPTPIEYASPMPAEILAEDELIAERWRQWLRHDPVNLVRRYRGNLSRLSGLYIDCGWRDQFRIHYGSRQLSKRLLEHGIEHRYDEFDGTHSGIDHRMDVSLPYLYKAIRG